MSTCNVDVRWFPFDIQKCELKFGSWTYDGWLLDLQMSDADVSSYMPNGEWDLIGEQERSSQKIKKIPRSSKERHREGFGLLPAGVPGTRSEAFYDCCKEPYPAVTFVVTIRRRTLYYALNLLIPCVLLSSMTLLIFVLPADSGEKISLGELMAGASLRKKTLFALQECDRVKSEPRYFQTAWSKHHILPLFIVLALHQCQSRKKEKRKT